MGMKDSNFHFLRNHVDLNHDEQILNPILCTHAFGSQVVASSIGIPIFRVPTVDDDVTGFKMRQEELDKVVHWLPGFHLSK